MTLIEQGSSVLSAPGPYTAKAYTSSMAITTIRVDTEVRDRLAARARAHDRSLGAELSAMLDELMWQGIEDGYRRLAADEAEVTAYRSETSGRVGAAPCVVDG